MSTWSFFPTAQTVIKASLRRIRGFDPEDATTISATQYANALETLNFIVAAWQAKGYQVWCRKTAVCTMVASQNGYTIGASGADFTFNRPLSVMQAWRRDTTVTPNIDIELEIVGPERYNKITNKDTTGVPLVLWYDAQYDGASNTGTNSKGNIKIWPTPDTTIASQYSLVLYYQRPLENFDATSDSLDMPQEWFDALRLYLAYKIAPEYGLQASDYDRLKEEMKEAVDEAWGWDNDMDSIRVSPAHE